MPAAFSVATSRALETGKQRTDEKDRRVPADGNGRRVRHAGEPGQTAAAGETKQHRFRLIVERVRCEDVFVSGARRGFRQQPVAREARRLLQAGLRLSPRQRSVRCAIPSRRARRFTAAASRVASGRRP